MAESAIERRVDYPHFLAITTRWMQYLIRAGGLDIEAGPVIGLAVETMGRFHRPLAYPDPVDAGLRVGRLGRSSVRYEIGLFSPGHDEPAATGHFVHVFVDRATRRPAPIPATIRSALARLLPPETHGAG